MTQVAAPPGPLSKSEKFWRYMGTRPLGVSLTPLIFLAGGIFIAIGTQAPSGGITFIVLGVVFLALLAFLQTSMDADLQTPWRQG